MADPDLIKLLLAPQQAAAAQASSSSHMLPLVIGAAAAAALYLYSKSSGSGGGPDYGAANAITASQVPLLGPVGSTPATVQVAGARFFCSAADAEQSISQPLSAHPKTSVLGSAAKYGTGSTCLNIQDSPALVAPLSNAICPDFTSPQNGGKLMPNGRLVCNVNYAVQSPGHGDGTNAVAILVPGGPGGSQTVGTNDFNPEQLFNRDNENNSLSYTTRPFSFPSKASNLLSIEPMVTGDSISQKTDSFYLSLWNSEFSTLPDSASAQIVFSTVNLAGSNPSLQDFCWPDGRMVWKREGPNKAPVAAPEGGGGVPQSWMAAFGTDSGVSGAQIVEYMDGNDFGFPSDWYALINPVSIKLRSGDTVTSLDFQVPDCSHAASKNSPFNAAVAQMNITPALYEDFSDTNLQVQGVYTQSGTAEKITNPNLTPVWGQIICPGNVRCTKTETAPDGSLICSNVSTTSGAYQIECNANDFPQAQSDAWQTTDASMWDAQDQWVVLSSTGAQCMQDCLKSTSQGDTLYAFCTTTCSQKSITSYLAGQPENEILQQWADDYGFNSTWFSNIVSFKNGSTGETINLPGFQLAPGDTFDTSSMTFTFTPATYLGGR